MEQLPPAFRSDNPQHGPLRQGEEWKIRDPNTGRDQTGRYTCLYLKLIRDALPSELNGLPIRVGESKPLDQRHIRVRRASTHSWAGVMVILTNADGSLPFESYGRVRGIHVRNLTGYQPGYPNRGGGKGAVRSYPNLPAIQAAVAEVVRLTPEDVADALAWEREGIPSEWWDE